MFSSLQKKFSKTDIAPASPPFKAYAEADLSKSLLIVDSNKVCGSMRADAEGKLRSMVDMQVQLTEDGSVSQMLMNGSDEVLFPLKIGPQLLGWFPVIMARRGAYLGTKGNQAYTWDFGNCRF